MNLSKPISTIMTSELITIPDSTPVNKLKGMFQRKGVHHILVEDDEQHLLGVISNEDFLRAAHFPVNEDSLCARHIMTATPTTVDKEATIHQVLEMFLDNYFRCLPVIDYTKRLVGIVTPYDIMALVAGRVETQTFKL